MDIVENDNIWLELLWYQAMNRDCLRELIEIFNYDK